MGWIKSLKIQILNAHISLPDTILFDKSVKRQRSAVQLVVQKAARIALKLGGNGNLFRRQEFLRLLAVGLRRIREEDRRELGKTGPPAAQHRRAHQRSFQPNGGVINHDKFRALDQLIRAEILLRLHKKDIGQCAHILLAHPIRHALTAFFARAGLIRVRADDKQSVRMSARPSRPPDPARQTYAEKPRSNAAGWYQKSHW